MCIPTRTHSCVMHTYAHLQCLETKAWSSEHLQTDKCSTCIAWTSDKSWLSSQARYALGEDFRKGINWLPRVHPRVCLQHVHFVSSKTYVSHTHADTFRTIPQMRASDSLYSIEVKPPHCYPISTSTFIHKYCTESHLQRVVLHT